MWFGLPKEVAKRTIGITPNEDGTLSIDPKTDGAQKMAQAISTWHNVKEELKSGQMSEDDYRFWKSSFRL